MRAAKAAAGRSVQRLEMQPVAAKTYADNLDGWIREALDIMKSKGIPGSYNGLHRNIMRESSGNPNAINNWDINAVNGIPSKGLLQVIPPTFQAYHVPARPGTSTTRVATSPPPPTTRPTGTARSTTSTARTEAWRGTSAT